MSYSITCPRFFSGVLFWCSARLNEHEDLLHLKQHESGNESVMDRNPLFAVLFLLIFKVLFV